MPNSLDTMRKQISKKRKGVMNSMHHKSRDSKRLHKAQVREERLGKLADARKKKDQPLLGRVTFFQELIRENDLTPLDIETIQAGINVFVHQHDEEYEEVKKTRRAGRPATAREDLLRMKIEALEKEACDGFFMPDLTVEENVKMLDRFEGVWAFLTNLSWVKVSGGNIRPSTFPPK